MGFEAQESATSYNESNCNVPVQQFLPLTVNQIADESKDKAKKALDITMQKRWERIRDFPLKFVDSPEFYDEDAEEIILRPMPESTHTSGRKPAPEGLPPYLKDMYNFSVLTTSQEVHLFRSYNFCKFRAASLRSEESTVKLSVTKMDEIEHYHTEAQKIRNKIIEHNLRLVVSIAKRDKNEDEDFFTKISEGNMALMRSLETFDYTQGNKFSTYASWAIKKRIYNFGNRTNRNNVRQATNNDDIFKKTIDRKSNPKQELAAQKFRESKVDELLKNLEARARQIIVDHFGIGVGKEPMTLKEIGGNIGMTKEGVRQNEVKALNKLREVLQSLPEKQSFVA